MDKLFNLIINNIDDVKILLQEYIDNSEDIVNQLRDENLNSEANNLDKRLDLADEMIDLLNEI